MTDDYDPQLDGLKSYYLAIETKRLRGDKHDWVDAPVSNPLPTRADCAGAAPTPMAPAPQSEEAA